MLRTHSEGWRITRANGGMSAASKLAMWVRYACRTVRPFLLFIDPPDGWGVVVPEVLGVSGAPRASPAVVGKRPALLLPMPRWGGV